jgi:hypothetical protein
MFTDVYNSKGFEVHFKKDKKSKVQSAFVKWPSCMSHIYIEGSENKDEKEKFALNSVPYWWKVVFPNGTTKKVISKSLFKKHVLDMIDFNKKEEDDE